MINQAEIDKIIQENKALKEHCSELETQVKWLMEQLKITNKKLPNLKEDGTIDALLPWNAPEACRSYLRKGDTG